MFDEKIVIGKGWRLSASELIVLTDKQKKKRKQNQSDTLRDLRRDLVKITDTLPEESIEFAEEILTSEAWSHAYKKGGREKGVRTMRAITANTNHAANKTLVIAYISNLLQIISTN